MSEAISAALPFHTKEPLVEPASASRPRVADATTEPRWVRWMLIAAALLFLFGFLLLPLLLVFVQALGSGVQAFIAAITEADALAAIASPLLVAGIGGALEPGLRHRRRGMGGEQTRIPRQAPAGEPDRPAVRGIAGGGGAGLRADLRRRAGPGR